MNTTPCMRPDLQPLAGRYEVGALTQDESAAFETHILECDECVAELERGAPMAQVLREQRPRFAAMLREGTAIGGASAPATVPSRVARKQLSAAAPQPNARLAALGWQRFFRLRLLVPASVMLLVGLGLWQQARRSDIRRWASFPREIASAGSTVRGSESQDAVAELLDAGAAYFELGQYAEAEGHFRSALERDPESEAAAYGLGLVLAASGDPRAAIPFLERAAEQSESERHDTSLWVLANAHLAAGDRESSLPLLTLLGSSSGSYASRAQDLERRLRQ